MSSLTTPTSRSLRFCHEHEFSRAIWISILLSWLVWETRFPLRWVISRHLGEAYFSTQTPTGEYISYGNSFNFFVMREETIYCCRSSSKDQMGWLLLVCACSNVVLCYDVWVVCHWNKERRRSITSNATALRKCMGHAGVAENYLAMDRFTSTPCPQQCRKSVDVTSKPRLSYFQNLFSESRLNKHSLRTQILRYFSK